jgi:hypothetical protein
MGRFLREFYVERIVFRAFEAIKQKTLANARVFAEWIPSTRESRDLPEYSGQAF